MSDSRVSSPNAQLGHGDGLPDHYRRVVSFAPRGGRLNDVQRRAWAEHAEKWLLEAEQYADLREFDQGAVFGRTAPLVVEIGSGMGESTAAMGAARPDIDLLAVEVYKPGVAQTFFHLARTGAENVRVLRADAVTVLNQLIPPGRLDELWLFFPDPWPKTKHHKRRLVTVDFARLVASRLRPGGLFRMATDWEPYAMQMLASVRAVPELVNRHDDWAPRPQFRPITRFENRGHGAGRAIFDLELQRAEDHRPEPALVEPN